MSTYYSCSCRLHSDSVKAFKVLIICSLILHLALAAYLCLRPPTPAVEMTVELGELVAPAADTPLPKGEGQGRGSRRPAIPATAAVPRRSAAPPFPQPIAKPRPAPAANFHQPAALPSPTTLSPYSHDLPTAGGAVRGVPALTPVPFPEQQRRLNTAAPFSSYSSSRAGSA